jgi:hypothetical protein
MNQPTESEFLDDVGLKKPDRSTPQYITIKLVAYYQKNEKSMK